MLPQLVWRYVHSKRIFLTFDDGPIPEATPYVLDTLAQYDAKATFFCVGENIEKHPEIYQRILDEGHAVGNHTYNHLNGWHTPTTEYIDNVKKAEPLIESNLYRPPYGKLKPSQYRALKDKYKIIMWDVLSLDYDSTVSADRCKSIVLEHSKPGSIIVMHDSLKSIDKLKLILPSIIESWLANGWELASLTHQPQKV